MPGTRRKFDCKGTTFYEAAKEDGEKYGIEACCNRSHFIFLQMMLQNVICR